MLKSEPLRLSYLQGPGGTPLWHPGMPWDSVQTARLGHLQRPSNANILWLSGRDTKSGTGASQRPVGLQSRILIWNLFYLIFLKYLFNIYLLGPGRNRFSSNKICTLFFLMFFRLWHALNIVFELIWDEFTTSSLRKFGNLTWSSPSPEVLF